MAFSLENGMNLTTDGLAVRSFEEVHDVVDFRLDRASRPSVEQLDEGITRQLHDLVHGHEHERQHHPEEDLEKSAAKEVVAPPEPLYVSDIFKLFVSTYSKDVLHDIG